MKKTKKKENMPLIIFAINDEDLINQLPENPIEIKEIGNYTYKVTY